MTGLGFVLGDSPRVCGERLRVKRRGPASSPTTGKRPARATLAVTVPIDGRGYEEGHERKTQRQKNENRAYDVYQPALSAVQRRRSGHPRRGPVISAPRQSP